MPVRASCAALLLGAATALGAEQELSVYPGAPHTRIGDTLAVAGSYLRLAYFVTPDSPRRVGRHFALEWERQGLPTTTDGTFEEEGVVSAIQTREGVLRSVVLRRHLGATVGLSVLRDLWNRPPPPRTQGLVRPEGTLYSQDASASEVDGDVLQRSALLALDLATTREQVMDQLAAAGLSLQRERIVEEAGQPHLVLEHGGPGREALTALVALGPGLTVASQTLRVSARRDGPPAPGAGAAHPRTPPGRGATP